jgi:asparagine synthase (glutamine-hydrolysing)
MCGIALILCSDNSALSTEPIERMIASLRHRGPDEEAVYRDGPMQMGHTRLSIIDLAGGAQPMSDASGRFTIIFNGEIYNYQELRRELEAEGETFRTHSDTESLLAGYRRWRSKLLDRLRGQYAFAIWDRHERRLFAARDRFGEKPLFWARGSTGELIIASEIKAILASGHVQPRLDRVSVDAFLALGYVPPDRTIYENIATLRPAHYLTCDDDIRIERYWAPDWSNDSPSDVRELISETSARLENAVERTLVADVPVGAFLSGGVDSSAVVCLAAKHSGGRLSTFCVGFGDLIDETPFAREVAQKFGTDHHEIQMNIPVGELLTTMTTVYDEPFSDSSNIPTFLLAQYARRFVKTAVAGDGGDEIFGGYDWYAPPLLSMARNETERLDRGMRRAMQLTKHALRHGPLIFRQWSRGLRKQCGTVDGDPWSDHVKNVSAFGGERRLLWGDDPPDSFSALEATYRPDPDVVAMDRVSDFDLNCYLPGDILVKVDRAAMAHGLETRAPLLDVDLVQTVLAVQWQIRFRKGTGKFLLQEALGDCLPDKIRTRKKQGFGAPINRWLRRPDVQELWQEVTSGRSQLRTLLPGLPRFMNALYPQQQWTLLCLGLWLRQWNPA